MSLQPQIPFVDLVAPHVEMEAELLDVTRTVLSSAGFIGGPLVAGFERDFAAYCEVAHAIAVNSGTDALRFALLAAGVAESHIVLTVANTFIATTEAITQAGARPDFIEIDERTYNMDPRRLREFLERECVFDARVRRTIHRRSGRPVTAVIPVHLFGQCADMDAILEQAERFNLTVIEDACQAHGAEYFSKNENRWRKAGSMGRLAAFSFYPGKNLGACGEGGAVTTQDEEMARRVRMLRDHGQAKKYYHDIEGYNGRLDALQAGYLAAKLRRLEGWNQARREHAARYRQLLAPLARAVILPHVPGTSRPVFHLYVVRVANREGLQEHLAAAGIGTGIHYPIPLHLQKAYIALGYRKGDLPITELAAREIVSLPMFPQLTEAQLRQVADAVTEFLAPRKAVETEPLEAAAARG